MTTRTLTVTSGSNIIVFDDLDNDKEVRIEITHSHKKNISRVYLSKESLITLREHLNYIIKKLEP